MIDYEKFILACREGHAQAVKQMLAQGANPNGCNTTDGGLTPLMEACAHGHTEIVRMLLEKKNINVHCGARGGITALSLAQRKGNKTIIKLLKDAGAKR